MFSQWSSLRLVSFFTTVVCRVVLCSSQNPLSWIDDPYQDAASQTGLEFILLLSQSWGNWVFKLFYPWRNTYELAKVVGKNWQINLVVSGKGRPELRDCPIYAPVLLCTNFFQGDVPDFLSVVTARTQQRNWSILSVCHISMGESLRPKVKPLG